MSFFQWLRTEWKFLLLILAVPVGFALGVGIALAFGLAKGGDE